MVADAKRAIFGVAPVSRVSQHRKSRNDRAAALPAPASTSSIIIPQCHLRLYKCEHMFCATNRFMLQTGKMFNINLLAILLLRYVAQTWHIRTGCRYRRWSAFIKYPLWCWFLQYLFFSLVASSTWSRIMLWIFIYRIVVICCHTPFVESYALVKVSRSSALCWCDMLIPLFFFIQFPAVSFVSLKAKQLWRFKSRLISMH